jgi:TPP-dependent indolepyruvate ferredoxin oxidoreductase alpha subunit
MKTIAETVDSSASVTVDPHRTAFVLPEDFELPPGGLNIRWPDRPLDQEFRLHRYKLYAALAFARANRLDRIVIDSPRPRFGIVTTGKSYLDVMQALEDLGIDEAHAAEIGENEITQARIRSAVLELLAVQTADRLITPDGKAALKQAIAEGASHAVEGLHVSDVLFSEFVVQF